MYPLKFQPIFQKRLWGGQRLRTLLNKPIPRELQKEPLGESWELADLPPGTVKADSLAGGVAADGSFSSAITNGPLAGKTLHQVLPSVLGPQSSAQFFPLLVKFLDAQQDLSVQVHPDAAYSKNHPGSHLKSEAWYILHADPGSRIYKGLKAGTTKDQFRAALETGQVEPLLNAIKVRSGDCHYLPSGTVHALGAGILAAEIQTPSDTTFRVFDWNRLTSDGKPRQLHIQQALECINFNDLVPTPTPIFAPLSSNATRLVSCDYFTLDRLQLPQGIEQPIPNGESRIWIILEGQAVITCDAVSPASTTAVTRGDTLLLSASMQNARVKSIANVTLLEATLPASLSATTKGAATTRSEHP